MVSRVRGRTRCRRASGWALSPLAAAAADLVSASRPSSRAMACRVAADRASGCSNGTAAASSWAPMTAAALDTARSAPASDGQRRQQLGEVKVHLPLAWPPARRS